MIHMSFTCHAMPPCHATISCHMIIEDSKVQCQMDDFLWLVAKLGQ